MRSWVCCRSLAMRVATTANLPESISQPSHMPPRPALPSSSMPGVKNSWHPYTKLPPSYFTVREEEMHWEGVREGRRGVNMDDIYPSFPGHSSTQQALDHIANWELLRFCCNFGLLNSTCGSNIGHPMASEVGTVCSEKLSPCKQKIEDVCWKAHSKEWWSFTSKPSAPSLAFPCMVS